MDQEPIEIDLPPVSPMTDAEKLQALYGYLKLFLPSESGTRIASDDGPQTSP